MAKKRAILKKSSSKKKSKVAIPHGVKVIAVIDFISAAVLFFLGLLLVIVGIMACLNPASFTNKLISNSMTPSTNITGALTFFGPILIIIGVIFLGFALLLAIVGVYLLKLRRWARATEITLSSLEAVIILGGMSTRSLLSVLLNLFLLAIHLVIIGYLAFNERARKAFS